MPESKTDLRRSMLQSRDRLPADRVRELSRQIDARLQAFRSFEAAAAVGCYVSRGNEVDTHPLIRRALEQGKRVAVPRTGPRRRMVHAWIDGLNQLRTTPFGILEPPPDAPIAPAHALDLLLIPGVAFTPCGCRLGMGGGYYDRYLDGLTLPLIGLAYAFQILPTMPFEPHDRRVNHLVTENGIHPCRQEESP